MAVAIINGFFNVNLVRNNSNLNQGKNMNNGWSYFTKANYSTSQVAGNFDIFPDVNFVFDNDLIDNVMPNAGAQSPAFGVIPEVF